MSMGAVQVTAPCYSSRPKVTRNLSKISMLAVHLCFKKTCYSLLRAAPMPKRAQLQTELSMHLIELSVRLPQFKGYAFHSLSRLLYLGRGGEGQEGSNPPKIMNLKRANKNPTIFINYLDNH